MDTPAYISILSQPLAFWIANGNEANVPEVVRCLGIAPIADPGQLTVFISKRWGQQFVANLAKNRMVSFMGTSVPTYESYQYKGEFLSLRNCTEAEHEDQLRYLDAFGDEVAKIGMLKSGFYNAYNQLPSLAITFRVTDVFDQTPYKGTGIQVSKGGFA